MKKKIVLLSLLFFIILLSTVAFWLYYNHNQFAKDNPGANFKYSLKLLFKENYNPSTHKIFIKSKLSNEHKRVVLKVPKGSIIKIGKFLEKNRLIKNSKHFKHLVRLKGVDKKIKTGEFEFYTDMTPLEILDVLLIGKEVQYKVTIPENITYKEIADILEKAEVTKAKDFIKLCESDKIIKKYGIKALKKRGSYKVTLEGYLYPETYLFKHWTPAEKVVDRLVKNMREKIEPYKKMMNTYGWNEHQLLTFSSLIGKETGVNSERFLVSSVFHNRLKTNMLLQTDPTVIYMVTDRKTTQYHAGIMKKHLLDKKNPYNTYIYKGLPPGPIGNPGILSIEASVKPKKSKYLYFVSNNDGTHTFTTNYDDHKKAVKIYWQKVRNMKKK